MKIRNQYKYIIFLMILFAMDANAFELTIHHNVHSTCKDTRDKLLYSVFNREKNVALEGLEISPGKNNIQELLKPAVQKHKQSLYTSDMLTIQDVASKKMIRGLENNDAYYFGAYITYTAVLPHLLTMQSAGAQIQDYIGKMLIIIDQNTEVETAFQVHAFGQLIGSTTVRQLLQNLLSKHGSNQGLKEISDDLSSFVQPYGKVLERSYSYPHHLESDVEETITEIQKIAAQTSSSQANFEYTEQQWHDIALFNILWRTEFMEQNLRTAISEIEADSSLPQNLTVWIGQQHLAYLKKLIDKDENQFYSSKNINYTVQACPQ